MSRLTIEDLQKIAVRCVGKDLITQMTNELIKYKQIEEELGIELFKLFGAIFNGAYVKWEDKIIFLEPHLFYEICIISYRKENNKLIFNSPLGIQKKYDIYGFDLWFKYYGVTWALTKDELL